MTVEFFPLDQFIDRLGAADAIFFDYPECKESFRRDLAWALGAFPEAPPDLAGRLPFPACCGFKLSVLVATWNPASPGCSQSVAGLVAEPARNPPPSTGRACRPFFESCGLSRIFGFDFGDGSVLAYASVLPQGSDPSTPAAGRVLAATSFEGLSALRSEIELAEIASACPNGAYASEIRSL